MSVKCPVEKELWKSHPRDGPSETKPILRPSGGACDEVGALPPVAPGQDRE
jgi:hypothetical protein